MNKLSKITVTLFASGMILAGCSDNKALENKKSEKTLSYTTVKDIGDIEPTCICGSMSAESMLYEPLVRNTKDGIALLAKKWIYLLMVRPTLSICG